MNFYNFIFVGISNLICLFYGMPHCLILLIIIYLWFMLSFYYYVFTVLIHNIYNLLFIISFFIFYVK